MMLQHGRRKCNTHPLLHMFKLSDQKMTDVTAEQMVNSTSLSPSRSSQYSACNVCHGKSILSLARICTVPSMQSLSSQIM